MSSVLGALGDAASMISSYLPFSGSSSTGTRGVPIVDISPFVDEDKYDDAARERVAKEWDQAMTEVGFAIIKGHGVAPEVVSAMRKGRSLARAG